jgi:hypothetical protein
VRCDKIKRTERESGHRKPLIFSVPVLSLLRYTATGHAPRRALHRAQLRDHFCEGLSLCPRGHSFRNSTEMNVFCSLPSVPMPSGFKSASALSSSTQISPQMARLSPLQGGDLILPPARSLGTVAESSAANRWERLDDRH